MCTRSRHRSQIHQSRLWPTFWHILLHSPELQNRRRIPNEIPWIQNIKQWHTSFFGIDFTKVSFKWSPIYLQLSMSLKSRQGSRIHLSRCWPTFPHILRKTTKGPEGNPLNPKNYAMKEFLFVLDVTKVSFIWSPIYLQLSQCVQRPDNVLKYNSPYIGPHFDIFFYTDRTWMKRREVPRESPWIPNIRQWHTFLLS